MPGYIALRNLSAQFALASTLFVASQSVFAGPPLVTDDPGVLGTGGWEYTLAVEGDKRDAGDGFVAPGLEVAYGFNDAMQGAVSIARAVVDEPGSSSRSDFDAIGFEFKWQLYSDDNVAVAVAPAYSFPLTSSSTDRGIVEDVNVLSLPVIASYETGPWAFNVQFAYEATSTGPNGKFAGLAGGYAVNDQLTLLAEVYTVRVSGEDADEDNWNLGVEYAVNDALALLASYGGSLSSALPSMEELDEAFFVGLIYVTD